MAGLEYMQSAFDDAISHLNELLDSGLSQREREIVQRQIDLLKRTRSEDRVMAEKIAESFGFHAIGLREPIRATG